MATIQKRVTKSGEVSFRVQVRIKGRPPVGATFSRISDAKDWAQQTEADIKRGIYFKVPEANKRTLAEAIDRYFKDVLCYRRTSSGPITYLTWWKKRLGAYTLADITTAMVHEERSALIGTENRFKRSIGHSTANRYTQALGHLFNIAQKEWGWTTENPVGNIRKFKEPRGRVRFLSDDERTKLLDGCKKSSNKYLYTIVIIALSTGARKSEVLKLKWDSVDLARGQIVLHDTKNGENRVIPLEGYALTLVKKLHKDRILGCPYLFPGEKVTRGKDGTFIYQPIDIRTAWENVIKNAQIKDFKFHDLRHSAASYLAMNKASSVEIAEVLGHKTLQMVKRYAHLSDAHTKGVVAQMNERIFGNETI